MMDNAMPLKTMDEEDLEFEDARSEEEEWVLARRGIQMVLNNRYGEAQKLFANRKDSIQLAAGHCFIVFMNALMSFEEDMLAESQATLREMEKRCAQDIGWLKSMKNRVFGSEKEKGEGARLEEQIILADTQVCMALLTFLQQDVSGCVRGGWVLRKAWRVYQHTYHQILTLYKRTFPSDNTVLASELPSWSVMTRSPSNVSGLVESPSCDWSAPHSKQPTPTTPSSYLNGYRSSFATIINAFTPTPESDLEPEEVSRLMCAVSFGYGVFQLCISMLPPSLLKVIQLLGFGADRAAGLDALMFSRRGPDMRAPLATLALLWYHTIVRPFFALDGSNLTTGLDTATQLITDNQPEFADSALFLFFTGRIHRLKNEVQEALAVYNCAVNKSPQREVQLLCLHEVHLSTDMSLLKEGDLLVGLSSNLRQPQQGGERVLSAGLQMFLLRSSQPHFIRRILVSWCHLIQLDWAQAYSSFMTLKQRSRWSKIFYTYLAAVCAGANDRADEASRLSREIRSTLSSRSGAPGAGAPAAQTQLEDFVSRRAALLAPAPPATYCRLLAYEMLFLWNALPPSQYNCLITRDCETGELEPMVGLRSLILGTVQRCLGRRAEADASLRAAISARRDIPDTAHDSHVTAFALYELAQLLMHDVRECRDEARALLERAQRDFKGYDFESRLNVRIHAALRSLGQ